MLINMKKIFTRFATLAMVVVAALGFVACEDKVEEIPVSDATVEATVVSKDSQSVTFAITSDKADAVAYYRTPDTKFIGTGEFVFKNGKQVDPNTTVNVTMPYMETMGNYRLVVAARAANGAYTLGYANVYIPDHPATVSIEVKEVTYSVAKVTVTPTEYAVKYKVGFGAASATVEDFNTDKISTTMVNGNEAKTLTLDGLTPETEFIVYAQAYNNDGPSGDIISQKFTTPYGPDVDIQVSMENTIQANVTYTPNDKCGAVIGLAASASVYNEFVEAFGSEEDLLMTYYQMGMADFIQGEPLTSQWAMNGECDYEYIVAALVFDMELNLYKVVHKEFTSPSFDENAPEATLTITVGESTADGTQLIYTMGEGTLGYYQSVYTQTDYDELVAFGLENGMTEEEYIQQYTAFYGNVMFENEDYVWPLDPDTDMVAVGCPFNNNGIEGYGKVVIEKFRTAAEVVPSSRTEFVTKRKNDIKRALMVEFPNPIKK